MNLKLIPASVADRIALVRNGQIEQVGLMSELLRNPRTEFVAGFMRCENMFAGDVVGDGLGGTTIVRIGNQQVPVAGKLHGRVTLAIRPENVQVARLDSGTSRIFNTVTGRLMRIVDCGAYVKLDLDAFPPLVAHISIELYRRMKLVEGVDLECVLTSEHIRIFQEEGQ